MGICNAKIYYLLVCGNFSVSHWRKDVEIYIIRQPKFSNKPYLLLPEISVIVYLPPIIRYRKNIIPSPAFYCSWCCWTRVQFRLEKQAECFCKLVTRLVYSIIWRHNCAFFPDMYSISLGYIKVIHFLILVGSKPLTPTPASKTENCPFFKNCINSW